MESYKERLKDSFAKEAMKIVFKKWVDNLDKSTEQQKRDALEGLPVIAYSLAENMMIEKERSHGKYGEFIKNNKELFEELNDLVKQKRGD